MMRLSVHMLHHSPNAAARCIALGLLCDAHDASLRLGDPEDSEALHDFRVFIRRQRATLRAWNDLLKPKLKRKMRKSLSGIQRRTGDGRDTEVAIEWLEKQSEALSIDERIGFDALLDRLRTQYAEATGRICADVLRDFRKVESSLRIALQTMVLPADPREHTQDTYAAALAKKAIEHSDELAKLMNRIQTVEDPEPSHDARIGCKRLRYLVEPLRDAVPEAREVLKRCKRLQDVLGDLNDRNVLRDALLKHVGAMDPADPERPGLLAVIGRIEASRLVLFTKIQDEWLPTKLSDLQDRVQDCVNALPIPGAIGMEVERKFLLKSVPPVALKSPAMLFNQGYLPGGAWQERVRSIQEEAGTRYVRTLKIGSGLARIESEEDLSPELFQRMWSLTEGRRVQKHRHFVPHGDFVWEIDVFLDRELFLAEVELPSEDASVELPDWLAPHVEREVTEEDTYSNRNLAQ